MLAPLMLPGLLVTALGAPALAGPSVGTANLGLLKVGLRYTVPLAEERRDALPDALGALLDAQRPEVFLLQECYRRRDRSLLSDIAAAHGYAVVDHRPPGALTGLLLLVRDDLEVAGQGFMRLPGDTYNIAGYRRGVLWVSVRLEDGRTLFAGNSHLTPLAKAGASRRRARQVEHLARIGDAPPGCGEGCVTVLGGDYNLAPDHTWDWSVRATDQDREDQAAWLQRDAALFGRLHAAFGAEAGDVAPRLFTLDARNPLWTDYPLSWPEPSRRVDLLFVRGAELEAAALALTESGPAGVPVSDHYALVLTLR